MEVAVAVLAVPYTPYGLCERKATLNLNAHSPCYTATNIPRFILARTVSVCRTEFNDSSHLTPNHSQRAILLKRSTEHEIKVRFYY